jgi:general stress protein YciG
MSTSDENHTSTNNDEHSTSTSDAPETTAKIDSPKPRKPRGFAAMDRKLVSEIARKGGRAAHSAGTAHEFTTDEARNAGRKGGLATHAKRHPQATPAITTAVEETKSPPPDRPSQKDTLH